MARSTGQPSTPQHFFYAEDYHQQYLARNLARGGIDPKDFYFGAVAPPAQPIAVEGYCGMQPTGVSCPIGLQVEAPDTKAAP